MRQLGAAFGQQLAVAAAGRGHHHHTGATKVRTPAQVDVVAVERNGGVEAADDPEQVGAHEEARGREREGVAHRIVLLLVVLPRLDDGVDLAEAVDTEAHVLQHSRLRPRDELGADDAGVGAVELLHQQANGVGVERHVVVQEAEEAVVAFDQPQHLVGGSAETRVAGDGPHERIRHPLADAGRHVARLTDHEKQVLQVGVILRRQCIEHFLEPWAGLMHHHHGHYGRGERSGGFHEHSRLAAQAPPRPVTPPSTNDQTNNCLQ